MSKHSFKTFKEASVFAKKRRGTLRHSQDGFDVTLPNAHILVKSEPKCISQDLKISPTAPKISSDSGSAKSAVNARLCVDCGAIIPSSRVEAVPTVSRCIKCQSEFEYTHDTRPHINEGLPGTRDENKKMRGQLWGDVRNRGRGH